ncbi:aa3-type cytochrome c oxidase subunit IV [Roseicella aerolata]|uniref:Aa3-type cytochrome c oxidase subunit IV n=1 Tax=Roseicella aerolata TaxID=2883479 RepID=A0A9X1IGW7_9PROT|nr:aa3-type cytochrome c oxidase subunit IV [Roseicella aerolata]MCB4824616.1 aa3-type cytochrome c oxidase subunit IV [Roseicella aerolata]
MAEKESYDFAATDAKDILADRQRGWEGFTQFVTWGVAISVIVLLALLLFVA